jgi:transcription-repair coupling factor (superfamily II helicase)
MTSTAPSAGTLAHLPTDWAARHTDWGLGAHVGDQTALLDLACVPGARPLVLAVLAGALPVGAQVLAVTATTREADDLAGRARGQFLDPALVVGLFPSWETLPHERLSPAATPSVAAWPCCVASPTRTPHASRRGGPSAVVVAPVRAVLQPIARGSR